VPSVYILGLKIPLCDLVLACYITGSGGALDPEQVVEDPSSTRVGTTAASASYVTLPCVPGRGDRWSLLSPEGAGESAPDPRRSDRLRLLCPPPDQHSFQGLARRFPQGALRAFVQCWRPCLLLHFLLLLHVHLLLSPNGQSHQFQNH
jgi:hypothetical protein